MSPADPPLGTTVAQALKHARTLGVDRLDAQLLMCAALQRPRAWLIAHDDARVPADALQRFESHAGRRAAGEPLAYVLGEKEFHGLTLHVAPGVLVPRPDTETLVTWALALLPVGDGCHVADLGTGSGAIALALKTARPQAQVVAVDASAPALAQARANGKRLGLAVDWRLGDWCGGLPADVPFELIVSNPPYIAELDPHLEALRFEPLAALTSGSEGLDDLRRIVQTAPVHLCHGAWLLLEHGWNQGEAVRGLLTQRGFQGVTTRPDLAGHERCTGGQWFA